MFPFRSFFFLLLVFFSVSETVLAQEKQKTIAEIIYSQPGSWALPALIPYRQGKLWGYADSTGVVRIKPQFTYAGFFSNGLASVRKGELVGVIDTKGKLLFKGKYPEVYVDRNEIVFFRTAKEKYGVCNKDHKVILKPIYTSARVLSWDKNNNPLILAWIDKRNQRKYRSTYKDGKLIEKQSQFTGLFDKNGKVILPLKYRSIELIGAGVIEATTGYYDHISYYYFTTDGKPIKALDGYQLSAYYSEYKGFIKGISPVRKDYKFGYADSTGHIIVPLIYDEVKSFTDGFGAVRIKTKWGFVNRQGEVVIPIIYDDVKPFYKGFAAVKFDWQFGLIDKKGKVIVDYKYDSFYDTFQGTFYFYKNGVAKLRGLRLQNADSIRFTCDAPEIGIFRNGYAFVRYGATVNFMDENCKMLLPFQYIGLGGITDSLVAAKEDKFWGVINLKNEVLVPFVFERLTILKPDRFLVMLLEGKGMYQMALINSQFQEVAPLQYNQISLPHHDKMFTLTNKEMGFIDMDGRELMKVPIPDGYTTYSNNNNDTLTYGLREIIRLSDNQKDYIDWKGTKYFKD